MWIGFVETTALPWAMTRAVARDALGELLGAVLFDVVVRAAEIGGAPPA